MAKEKKKTVSLDDAVRRVAKNVPGIREAMIKRYEETGEEIPEEWSFLKDDTSDSKPPSGKIGFSRSP